MSDPVSGCARGGARDWVWLAGAVVLLNALFSFHNVWPTPWIRVPAELSVEAAALLFVLALLASRGRVPGPMAASVVALLLTLACLGRYAEVTAPALYGRPINLYWDGQHLPQVAAMLLGAMPAWASVLAVLGAVALVAGLFWGLRRLVLGLTQALRWRAPRGAARAIGGSALALFTVGTAGELPVRYWFSLPVSVTYAQQAAKVVEAVATRLHPPSDAAPPLPPSDLGKAAAVDVVLVFLESYGATVFDRVQYRAEILPRLERFQRALDATPLAAVSAFVTSPTFGGGSWLAHSSVMAGELIADSDAYERLLNSTRATVVQRFHEHGHRTVAVMSGLKRAWPEGSFYGFDALYGEAALDYRGPEFGWWRIPDQFALARLDELERAAPARPPVFAFLATINTHIPFTPTPPYQPDWTRLLGTEPFAAGAVAESLAATPDWLNPGASYVRSMLYALDVIEGYALRRQPRDLLLVVLGDHQPAASVTGEGARWDVPVHVISTRRDILGALRGAGFQPGMMPQGRTLGPMHRLTATLLAALRSGDS